MITEYEKNLDISNLTSKGNTIVEFYSKMCGPCKMLSFILNDIDESYKDGLNILKISFEDNPKLAEKYKVEGYPTLIMVKNGKEISRKAGLQQKPAIIEMIEEAKNA